MFGCQGIFDFIRRIKLFVKLAFAYLNPFDRFWRDPVVFELWKIARLDAKVEELAVEADEDLKKMIVKIQEMVRY